MASMTHIDPGNTQAHPSVFFRHHIPQKPLSEFVELFWYWSGHHLPYSKERILPMGTVDLVIKLENHPPSDSGISGVMSKSVIIERTAEDQLLGIHFKAGGAFPFLGFPFGELHNLGITLADLYGERQASRLLYLLYEATTVEKKFQVLEQWLMLTAKHPLMHHPAVVFALREFEHDPGLRSSAEVAAKVNLSQRRFIQLFQDEVGLTPKLFCRVKRFQDVIRVIHRQVAVDWVDVALSSGYFDQSHFNHEFKEFSGLSPTEYLALRTEHLRHVQFGN